MHTISMTINIHVTCKSSRASLLRMRIVNNVGLATPTNLATPRRLGELERGQQPYNQAASLQCWFVKYIRDAGAVAGARLEPLTRGRTDEPHRRRPARDAEKERAVCVTNKRIIKKPFVL